MSYKVLFSIEVDINSHHYYIEKTINVDKYYTQIRRYGTLHSGLYFEENIGYTIKSAEFSEAEVELDLSYIDENIKELINNLFEEIENNVKSIDLKSIECMGNKTCKRCYFSYYPSEIEYCEAYPPTCIRFS